MKKILRKSQQELNQILGSMCVLCHEKIHTSTLAVCEACRLQLPFTEEACPFCARHSFDGQICGACQQKPPAFVHCFAGYDYAFPMAGLIQAFKYQKKLMLAQALGQLMQHRPPPFIDIGFLHVMAVPISAEKWRERGFNQSHELAKNIARHWQIPLISPHLCDRVATPSQSLLNESQRIKNIQGVFSFNRVNFNADQGKILLIDDVLTTCATVSEIAAELKHHGRFEVYVWALLKKTNRKNLTSLFFLLHIAE